MEVLLVLAAALWFFLQALEALLSYLLVPAPPSRLVIFVYCLIAGLILLYFDGYLPGHGLRL